MFKRSFALTLAIMPLVSTVAVAMPPDLVAWYRFNEGTGAIASDSSGNAYQGKILGTPTWVTRPDGTDTALAFAPGQVEGVELPTFDPTDGTGMFTVALWAIWDGDETYHHFFTKSSEWGTETMMFQLELWGGSTSAAHFNRIGISYDPDSIPFQLMPREEWVHVAFVYDGAEMVVYMNGVDDVGPQPVNIGDVALDARTVIGAADDGQRIWTGILDDVSIYSRPLELDEVFAVMKGDMTSANSPSPSDGAINVRLDTTLRWRAGDLATGHDVYFGTTFEAVDAATRQDTQGVLVSQDQSGTVLNPASLEYETTYYWRIDEVNGTPDDETVKGTVWRFTTEPQGHPIGGVTATASHYEQGNGPEQTVDGSGLNPNDEHTDNAADMWLATPRPGETLWIEFAFDKVRKLHEMLVWNHNTAGELLLGFGAKDVTVAHSVDGQTWTTLGDVRFAQATGRPDYTANTSVPFGDIPVKHVRLTILGGWGDTGQIGLSEVRFLAIPVEAQSPRPFDGAGNVDVACSLGWVPGRGAVAHEVYLDQNIEAVDSGEALIGVVDANGYAPGELDLASTYFWKIAEVVEGDPLPWAGDIWSFTTQDYVVVEDFENYSDDWEAGEAIWQTWIDGWEDAANGSVVGYEISPFSEHTIVRGGNQSMPLTYDNTAADYSEAYRVWDVAQNWSYGRADALTVHFRGHPVDFVQRADGSILMGAAGADLWGTSDEFRFAYKELSGDGEIIARVDHVAAVSGWTKAGVMIRETLDPGSKHAVVVVTPANGVAFQYRKATNRTSSDVHETGPVAPYWVKLTRTGNTLTAARSVDGQNWAPITADPAASTVDIVMANNVYIGLALVSTSANNPTVAEFSKITTNALSAWDNQAIGVEMLSNDPESIYVIVEDASGHALTVRHKNPEASNTTAWEPWTIALSAFTEADVDVAAVRKMTIGLGHPGGGGSGVIYIDDIQIGGPGGPPLTR